jgi:hypothetical protein
MADNPERVKIWNSFFKLAWLQAKQAYELSTTTTCADTFDPLGGTLVDSQHASLATLALTSLAIEARVNHLIEELVEEGRIDKDLGRAARWLPTKHKWFLLPALAGTAKKLDAGCMPHQAIATICELRNDLMHVQFDKLSSLPTGVTLQNLFANFVAAMEDMNVVLNRERPTGPIQKVLDMGRFRACK